MTNGIRASHSLDMASEFVTGNSYYTPPPYPFLNPNFYQPPHYAPPPTPSYVYHQPQPPEYTHQTPPLFHYVQPPPYQSHPTAHSPYPPYLAENQLPLHQFLPQTTHPYYIDSHPPQATYAPSVSPSTTATLVTQSQPEIYVPQVIDESPMTLRSMSDATHNQILDSCSQMIKTLDTMTEICKGICSNPVSISSSMSTHISAVDNSPVRNENVGDDNVFVLGGNEGFKGSGDANDGGEGVRRKGDSEFLGVLKERDEDVFDLFTGDEENGDITAGYEPWNREWDWDDENDVDDMCLNGYAVKMFDGSSERVLEVDVDELGENEVGLFASAEYDENGFNPERSYQISFRRIGAGLMNLGNTYFLNSVLQCLTYKEPLAVYLQSVKHQSSCRTAGICGLCAIQKHVSSTRQSTGSILALKEIVSNLRCISRNFRNSRQEDAHKYMANLLESMHKCCLPSGVPSDSSSAFNFDPGDIADVSLIKVKVKDAGTQLGLLYCGDQLLDTVDLGEMRNGSGVMLEGELCVKVEGVVQPAFEVFLMLEEACKEEENRAIVSSCYVGEDQPGIMVFECEGTRIRHHKVPGMFELSKTPFIAKQTALSWYWYVKILVFDPGILVTRKCLQFGFILEDKDDFKREVLLRIGPVWIRRYWMGQGCCRAVLNTQVTHQQLAASPIVNHVF